MKVYTLIPVFNRLEHTQKVIAALRAQNNAEEIEIVIIDDGSTDGTADYLKAQPDITTLSGDGNLWWAGAIQKGLEYARKTWSPDDYVLFMNNDTWFAPDYVQSLIDASRNNGHAAVGSVVYEQGRKPPLESIGPKISIGLIAVWDVFDELSAEEIANPKPVYALDALSGRGTLYPCWCFQKFGLMRPAWLPHYKADYEVAMRFRRAGVPLIANVGSVVWSLPVYGNSIRGMNLWTRTFSRRSSSNILHSLAFYLLVGSPLQRISAPLRMLTFAAIPNRLKLGFLLRKV